MGISTAGHKTICVPAPLEADYQKLIQKGSTFRTYLDPLIESYPELFPTEIANGYWLHDILRSKKLNLTTRRIQMVASKSVYQVRPDFALPYMIGKTDGCVAKSRTVGGKVGNYVSSLSFPCPSSSPLNGDTMKPT